MFVLHLLSGTHGHGKPGLMIYQIRIKGHLNSRSAEWVEGLTVASEENGETLLVGSMDDQAALHGFFKKLRDSGIHLISVNPG